MKPPLLDITFRAALAQRLLAALEESQPGSTAGLRGSLAFGTADACSDIDLLWEVPDDAFQACLHTLPAVLARVHAVASLRFDPAFQHSLGYRLVFIQFAGIPLFWRVDLEVFTFSIHRNPEYDRQDAAAMDQDWSPTHSALMNAVAAIKALLRGRDEVASRLLLRAYERVGLTAPPGETAQLVVDLCEQVARLDPSQPDLVQQILDLHRQVFGWESPGGG